MSRLIAAAAAPAATAALAHGGESAVASSPAELLVGATIALSAVAYACGFARLWRAERHRGTRLVRAASFATGSIALAFAAIGPLAASAQRSFAAHMIEHELLMLVAAPLLVAGRPLAVWAWAPPRRFRRRATAPFRSAAWARVGRAATGATGASVLQLALLLAWHAPRLFDAATGDPWIHALQHACFLAAGLAFSWAMLRAASAAASAFAAVGWLFVTMVVTGALGAALVFSPAVWYRSYAGSESALESQQLGGLVMWVPGGLAYVAAALAIGARGLARRPGALALRGTSDGA